jgi:cold shock CspA family protein
MTIDKYIPSGMFGFVTDGSSRLFFHLACFDPGAYEGEAPVPPVIGEEVEVEVGEGNKAERVSRLETPTLLQGVVDWFDIGKGYGFILSKHGKPYYLHRSEVREGKLPLPGRRVSFYVGSENRRACHVTVESR